MRFRDDESGQMLVFAPGKPVVFTALEAASVMLLGGEPVGERFIDEMYELYSAHIYDAEHSGEDAPDSLRFARSDESAPHWPLIVPFPPSFIDFECGA